MFELFKKFSLVKVAATFLIVGILLTTLSVIGIMTPQKEFTPTEAEIVRIDERTVGQDDPEYTVIVSYTVDGVTYESELGAYESGWKVGQKIECEYDPDDPANVRKDDGAIVPYIVGAAGIFGIVFGAFQLIRSLRTPAKALNQYDRVDVQSIDPAKQQAILNNTESMQNYVFHFTGKLNQSFVMKDSAGKAVYEAICESVKLVGETPFTFKNHLTGKSEPRRIGHTVTSSVGYGERFILEVPLSSAFTIDGKSNWDVLAEMGGAFRFSLNGIKSHFDVKRYDVPVGYCELAGTEVIKPQYAGNPLAKIPTNGIFRIECKPADAELFFLICFCLTRTELTIK